MKSVIAADSKHIVVVGAGLVGALLTLLLARKGVHVTLIEARSLHSSLYAKSPISSRTVALSQRSWQMLQQADLWPDSSCGVNSCPIKTIQVTERGRFGAIKIESEKLHCDALGYVVSNASLEFYLHQQLKQEASVEIFENSTISDVANGNNAVSVGVDSKDSKVTVNADLLVAADGTHSAVRSLLNIAVEERDYNQCALIANVAAAKPHNNVAHERFTDEGPLALLPLSLDSAQGEHLYSMILTASLDRIDELKECTDADLLAMLQKKAGGRFGRFTSVGDRYITPLRLTISDQQVIGRCALIGNAARTLHPVAGQGLNLALRDAFMLAFNVVEASDIETALKDFVASRKRDQNIITQQTDILARAFIDAPWPVKLPVSLATRSAFLLLDFIDPAKRHFAGLNMGLHQPLPRYSA